MTDDLGYDPYGTDWSTDWSANAGVSNFTLVIQLSLFNIYYIN